MYGKELIEIKNIKKLLTYKNKCFIISYRYTLLKKL